MSPAVRRWLRVGALLAFVILLLAFGRRVDWRAAAGAVRTANMSLLVIALMADQASLALTGVRWWVFLRPLGVTSLSLVLRATFAGASLNNLVVAQGGEGARVLLVARASGISSARVAAALALERVLDVASYLALLVSAVWLLPLPDVIGRWRIAASGALVVVALAVVALGASRGRGDAGVAPVGRVRAYVRRFTSSMNELASPGRLACDA